LCEGSGVHAERSGCGGRFLRWARESIVTFEEMTWGRRGWRNRFPPLSVPWRSEEKAYPRV
jgi:hypothetical protein